MIMEKLTFDDLIMNLRESMDELDGEVIADIFNHVCCKKIRYVEDGIWEFTGEEDSVEN
jgi:hypothetical protein